MARSRPNRPTPRWPLWLLVGLIALTAVALGAVVVVALQYRDDTATTAPTYAPIGDDRPPGLVLPDPQMSPGAVLPATVAEICVPGYSSKVRNVSTATRNKVYAAYNITHHGPGEYEVDHIVPLELGGSNEITNLFPQPAEPRPGFHEKDTLENTLHDLVCAGKLDLAIAQHEIATDWYAAYLKYVLHR
jgi:hypothetical protein